MRGQLAEFVQQILCAFCQRVVPTWDVREMLVEQKRSRTNGIGKSCEILSCKQLSTVYGRLDLRRE